MGKYKAETLKASLKMAITRLGIIKNKRGNAIASKEEEIANYLRSGNEEMALINVESVIAYENFISACEILCIMCSQCAERIRIITEFPDPPRDMLSSLHTLIYASPYSECQELSTVKQQLAYRYGESMVCAASTNKDGLVNSSVQAKLATTIPDEDLKVRKLEEIAAKKHVEYTPKQTFLAVFSTQSLDSSLPLSMTPGRGSEQPTAPIRFPTMATLQGGREGSKNPNEFPDIPTHPIDPPKQPFASGGYPAPGPSAGYPSDFSAPSGYSPSPSSQFYSQPFSGPQQPTGFSNAPPPSFYPDMQKPSDFISPPPSSAFPPPSQLGGLSLMSGFSPPPSSGPSVPSDFNPAFPPLPGPQLPTPQYPPPKATPGDANLPRLFPESDPLPATPQFPSLDPFGLATPPQPSAFSPPPVGPSQGDDLDVLRARFARLNQDS